MRVVWSRKIKQWWHERFGCERRTGFHYGAKPQRQNDPVINVVRILCSVEMSIHIHKHVWTYATSQKFEIIQY